MTTPGGCGQIPEAQRVGSFWSPSAYPSDDFTPTCTGGADSLTRTWNSGSSVWYDVPGVPNTVNSNYIEPQSGSVYTANIVAITSVDQGGYHAAALYCDKLSYGGYTDWFLPNRTELNIMWTNKASIPGLLTSGEFYWTTLEYDGSDKVFIRRFSDGTHFITAKNNGSALARCVRKY